MSLTGFGHCTSLVNKRKQARRNVRRRKILHHSERTDSMRHTPMEFWIQEGQQTLFEVCAKPWRPLWLILTAHPSMLSLPYSWYFSLELWIPAVTWSLAVCGALIYAVCSLSDALRGFHHIQTDAAVRLSHFWENAHAVPQFFSANQCLSVCPAIRTQIGPWHCLILC